jgi:hypothetical protein
MTCSKVNSFTPKAKEEPYKKLDDHSLISSKFVFLPAAIQNSSFSFFLFKLD